MAVVLLERDHDVVVEEASVWRRVRTHLLATVGAKGARAEIREWLVQHGWLEGRDFTCLA